METNRDLQIATASITKLEAKLITSERHSRSFNVRLLGVPETDGENCVSIVEDLLHQKFNQSGNVIENAHRIGKQTQDKPRHIIARIHSRVVRTTVMRATRTNLRDSKLRFVDDLTKEDMQEKQRVRPFMNELFKTTGVRLSETENYTQKAGRCPRMRSTVSSSAISEGWSSSVVGLVFASVILVTTLGS